MINFSHATKPNFYHPQKNEDAFLEDSGKLLFAVFDGMGGRKAGEMASQLAKENLKAMAGSLSEKTDILPDLSQIFEETHDQIKKTSQESTKSGIGTTATVIKISKNQSKAFIAHIGDSRIYKYSQGKLEKITSDDDVISLSLERGEITQNQAEKIKDKLNKAKKEDSLSKKELSFFEGRNVLSQALGVRGEINPHTDELNISKGDLLLLSTDGVHDNLTQEEIRNKLAKNKNTSLDQKVKNIVNSAFRESKANQFRSKPDDITALIIKVY